MTVGISSLSHPSILISDLVGTDTTRRDCDRRESSRTRRESSATRKERDPKERDRSRRRDERDDSRKDRDDYFRREWEDRDDGYRERDRFDYGRSQRDLDRDLDDDPRRWRDDGKRDERVATRKERERGWDRWEPSHDRDRLEERDSRSKRTSGRDRRSGAGLDDAKDKDEKKEREKEKEPAWMETYVPTTPGGGILGGQTVDGELDGIQAWKKSLKEKERKEKEAENITEPAGKTSSTAPETTTADVSSPAGENSLDEIQLFKLMMREAAKKDPEQDPAPSHPGSSRVVGRMSPAKLKEIATPIGGKFWSYNVFVKHEVDCKTAPASSSTASPGPWSTEVGNTASSSNASPGVPSDGSRLFSLFAQASTEIPTSQTSKHSTPNIPPPDHVPQPVSRLFPTPPGLSPAVSQNSERPTIDLTPSYPNTVFDPPAGSRLLAFGSRAAPGASQIPPKTLSPADSGNLSFHHSSSVLPSGPSQRLNAQHGMPSHAGIQQGHEMMYSLEPEPQMVPNPRATPSERSARSFSPFGQPHQVPFNLHEPPEGMRIPQADTMRRAPGPAERGHGYGLDSSPSFVDLGGGPSGFNAGSYELGGSPIGGGPSAAKGSRFAKFFDAKNREPQVNVNAGVRKASGGAGFVSTSPLPGQGRDHMAMNGMPHAPPDNRTMEDIFAMLQSSSQVMNIRLHIDTCINRRCIESSRFSRT